VLTVSHFIEARTPKAKIVNSGSVCAIQETLWMVPRYNLQKGDGKLAKERAMGLEDFFKGGNIVTGLAIGIGAAVVAPAITPVLRPIAKSLLKAGLMAYDQGRVALAEFNEHTSDMLAEARSELAEAGHESHAAASEGGAE
jgi:hypothetical protein